MYHNSDFKFIMSIQIYISKLIFVTIQESQTFNKTIGLETEQIWMPARRILNYDMPLSKYKQMQKKNKIVKIWQQPSTWYVHQKEKYIRNHLR